MPEFFPVCKREKAKKKREQEKQNRKSNEKNTLEETAHGDTSHTAHDLLICDEGSSLHPLPNHIIMTEQYCSISKKSRKKADKSRYYVVVRHR